MKILIALAAFSSVALPVAQAQQPERAPRFEIAEVQPSASAPNPYTWASGGVLRGSRYDFRKATMIDLIRVAYSADPETIVGGPNWLAFDRFDISAKTDPGTPPATVRLMLQNLLADRFKLAVRKYTRPMPAFALTAGKMKPKLKASGGVGDPDCAYQPQRPGSVDTVYACRNLTMDAFAEQIHRFAGDYLTSPVVNATGLDGTYDFDLRWHRRSLAVGSGSGVLPSGQSRVV